MDSVRSGLSTLAGLYALGDGPHSLLLAGHVLRGASLMHSDRAGRRQRFVLGFWIVFCACFGGSMLSGLLIQRPDLVPNPAFKDARILPFTLAAWYFTQYTQTGQWLLQSSLFKAVCRFASTFCRGRNICRVTEVAATLYPGVLGGPVILGTLAGTGGKLSSEYLLHQLGDLKKPSEITMPSFAMRSGFLGSVIYLLAVHLAPSSFSLQPEEGKALVVTVLILQAIVSELFGREVDITAPLNKTFHAVTNIPMFDCDAEVDGGDAKETEVDGDDTGYPSRARTPADKVKQADAVKTPKSTYSLRSRKKAN